MFQTFDVKSDPSNGAPRTAALRAKLKELGVDGFLVPHADEHQNEYVPERAERLAWLTGFTGSAGSAIVLAERAVVFVDGRYTLQVRDQVDLDVYEPVAVMETSVTAWIKANLSAGTSLAYDPWLHTESEVKDLSKAAEDAGARLLPLAENPIDAVWDDQPAAPSASIVPHPEEFAGRSSADKRADLAETLSKAKQDAAVITAPDSIAWLLNIRGGDVGHTPLPLSFALLKADGHVDLFVDPRKVDDALERHLGNAVTRYDQSEFLPRLGDLKGKRVRFDAKTGAAAIAARLREAGAEIADGRDPVVLPKACKNAAELAGARSAHVRDGAAIAKFLHWLSVEAPAGKVDEIAAAKQLEAFRTETGMLKEISFDTISGSGPNGAIVHYRVNESTNRALRLGELYLVDSGAQYLDGTTDITRTVAIGSPTEEMKDRFTRVLKGMIALTLARFPKDTRGVQLDALARAALWRAGLDYDHGTGHGVGSYLGVHEGPQNISKALRDEPLKPGMILSNEPGYYKTGAYGIRIENLVAVTEPAEIAGGERPMMSFETLTLAPIDRTLIKPDLLEAEELAWLNAYHATVRAALAPQLEGAAKDWLEAATEPV